MKPARLLAIACALAAIAPQLCADSSPPKPRYRVAYATYLGGKEGDQAREVIPAADGSALVGSQTSSTGMPVTPGAVQPAYAGDDPALGHPGIYGGDCYLTRIAADGSRYLAATYYGGSKQERNVYGMALDRQGNVVIASCTRSADIPTTPGAFQPKYGGGESDWFVAKVSADLTRVLWCTYVGGSGGDSPRGGLTVDAGDNVYVVGETSSPDFPTTAGVLQRERKGTNDAAMVKLRPDGSIAFATLLGGSDSDGIMGIRVDGSGNLYVGGHTRSADFPVVGAPQAKIGGKSDCFLAKLAPDAGRLLHSTFLGGSEDEFAEHQLLLDADGTVLLPGVSGSPDFPTTPGAFQPARKGTGDAFLTALSPDGKKWAFSTLIGGSGGEFSLMPVRDAQGNIHIVGQTSSPDFPVTPDALQPAYGGGTNDGFLAVFSPDGAKLLHASYLGGTDDDMVRSIAIGPAGEVYLVGSTASADFPATAGAAQTSPGGKSDAYIVKLVPERPSTASFQRGDANADGSPDLSDAVATLFFIFLGIPAALPCEKSADVDDSGALDLADAVCHLDFLFLGGDRPRDPFASCGGDTTPDELPCDDYPPCADLDPGGGSSLRRAIRSRAPLPSPRRRTRTDPPRGPRRTRGHRGTRSRPW